MKITLMNAASPEGQTRLKDADIIWVTDRQRGFFKLIYGKRGQMCQSVEIQIDSRQSDELDRATSIVAKLKR